MNSKGSIFLKRGDRVKLIMLLGGGQLAERFINAMEIEIRYEIDGYNRGARITDGVLQDTFLKCEENFRKLARFLDTLPEAVKQDFHSTLYWSGKYSYH